MNAEAARNQGYSHRSQVDQEGSKLSLLAFLATRFPRDAEAIWLDRIRAGEVAIDQQVCPADLRLKPGQWVTWNRPPWIEPEVPLCAAVLFEDEDLLAVAKPSGLPTLPGGGEFLEHTLLQVVRRRDPDASPMHRLGRGTSGLVLFARSALARRVVPELFRSGATHKVYRALCVGHPAQDDFRVEAPIGPVPHELLGTIHGATPAGKASASVVNVVARRQGCSLVEVDLLTGRPHQIRIHMAFAGHPLVGDPLYGPGGTPMPGTHALPGDLGYLLHAIRLDLPHPRTGEVLHLFCQPPPQLR
ncbi:MAG TPA: pseudouridine synthase [Geothrix sp.]|nr:pseudouridine synthase [Geothrix sp.]